MRRAGRGWTLVGMTGHPDALLARELALCYTPLTLVTDTDAGVVEGEGVTHAEALEVFAANGTRMRELVEKIIEDLPAGRDCPCPDALDGIKRRLSCPANICRLLKEHLLTYCGASAPARITGTISEAAVPGGVA